MSEILKKKQQQRITFLNKLYELSEGDTEKLINGAEVASHIGFQNGDENTVRNIANYLEGEGLIRVTRVIGGFPGSVSLTHTGLVEIESALCAPDKPTYHFLPINILNIGQMIGSNIQQGTINSQQTVTISNEVSSEIGEFIKHLQESIEQLDLQEPLSKELNAEIKTVEAQIESPKPKTSIIKDGLHSIGRILESTVGSAIGASLAEKIPYLLAMI